MDLESSEEGKISSEQKLVGGTLSGDTKVAISIDIFERMLEALSRTKESIGRASRHAIDCSKYSLASKVSLISVISSIVNKQLILFFLTMQLILFFITVQLILFLLTVSFLLLKN